MEYIQNKVLKDPAQRLALYERLLYSLEGLPDPWRRVLPAPRRMNSPRWQPRPHKPKRRPCNEQLAKICRDEDIPCAGQPGGQTRGWRHRHLRNDQDEIFIHDKCPHKGGPLSQGVFGRTVACPLHSWQIDLPRARRWRQTTAAPAALS